MAQEVTMEEINRISSMLQSTDRDMQELGAIAARTLLVAPEDQLPNWTWSINFAKNQIAGQAYRLGMETGKELLNQSKWKRSK